MDPCVSKNNLNIKFNSLCVKLINNYNYYLFIMIKNSYNLLKNKINKLRLNMGYSHLSESENRMKHTTYSFDGEVTTALWNLDSKQDFVWAKLNYLLVVDGHGKHITIDWIRKQSDQDLINAFRSDNPIKYLEDKLKRDFIDTSDSGACATAIIISDNKIDIFKVGDTSARVYINKELALETDDHSAFNKSEYDRKYSEGARFRKDLMMYCLPLCKDGTINLSKKSGYYIKHSYIDECAISRAIGHAKAGQSSCTGTIIEHKTVHFNDQDEILVMAASDGVWDMFHQSENMSHYTCATSLVYNATKRWHSDINFVHWEGHDCDLCRKKRFTNSSLPVISVQSGVLPDDISAVVWHREPIVTKIHIPTHEEAVKNAVKLAKKYLNLQ